MSEKVTNTKTATKKTDEMKGIDRVVRQAIERVVSGGTAPDVAGAAAAGQATAEKAAPRRRQNQQRSAEKSSANKGAANKPDANKPDANKAPQAAAKDAAKPQRQKQSGKAKPAVQVHAGKKKPQEKKPQDRDFKLKVIPLGGLGEVGKNMTLIQYGNDILVIDCGVSFPGDELHGIDLVIPDFSYLIDNKEKVRAYLLTHGHEDHIGGMPYVLKEVQAPVYGSALSLGLLKGKLAEHRCKADLRQISPREEMTIGVFKVEFFRVTHSIPDSMGIAIHTPVGTIMFISDFKMDMSPIDGKQMDFGRISELGEKGVLLLTSDSTNAEKAGFSESERSVGYNLTRHLLQAKGRVIVTSFASHVHRVQQAIWAAVQAGRKVAVVGRGMQNMVAIATELGYLDVPNKVMIDIDTIGNYPADKVVVLTTGSQGEPLSGLTRMASGEHRQVQIMAGDTVIICATPIPGNERMVSQTVDNLFRLGAVVIYEKTQGIHVSGHASSEELKMLLNMVKPRFFLPVHGEYRMLYKHALLAQQVGIPAENVFVMENGRVLELSRRHCRAEKTVPSGRVFIDGLGVGDVGKSVLRDRHQLSENGVIVVSMIYTKNRGKGAKILAGPEIYTRGFIFEKEYEHIIEEMKEKVLAQVSLDHLATVGQNDLRNQVRSVVSRFVSEKTGRKPVIMSLICEV